jgi:hypothetical protein
MPGNERITDRCAHIPLQATEIKQNDLHHDKGWTIFHELAQCDKDVRSGGLWTMLQKYFARAYTPLLDAHNKTALDHAILQRDVAGVEFFCTTLTTANSLECAGSVTNSLILLADNLPRQIVKVITWLDRTKLKERDPKSASTGSFQTLRKILHLAKPIEQRLTRASANADASVVWDKVEDEDREKNLFDCGAYVPSLS